MALIFISQVPLLIFQMVYGKRDLPRDNPLVGVKVLGKILRVLRIILVVLPEHPSDTRVLRMKMEILLEPTSNKLLVGDIDDERTESEKELAKSEKADKETMDDKEMHMDEKVHNDEEELHGDDDAHNDEYLHDDDEKHDDIDEEMNDVENVDELKDDQVMDDAEKVDFEKREEKTVDIEQVGDDKAEDHQVGALVSMTQNEKAEVPPSSFKLSLSFNYGNKLLNLSSDTSLVAPLLDVLVFVIHEHTTSTPLTTPLPTPPVSSEAPTITTTVPDPLPVVFQRLSDLERKFESWTNVDHSDAIEESVQGNIINEIKNQLPREAESLSELEQKKILFDNMDKSRSYMSHDKHQELYDALLNSIMLDEAIASGDVNPDKVLRKRDIRDVQNPTLVNAEEPFPKAEIDVEEPILDDVFNDLVHAKNPPLTFDDLMSTPIDFTGFAMNRLKINKLAKADLVGPVYKFLKGTCKSSIKLEYNIKQCYLALSDQLNWTNLEGDRCPYDLSKPLPLQGSPGHLTIPSDFFCNNDLEYLKTGDKEKKYIASITKTKVTRLFTTSLQQLKVMAFSVISISSNSSKESIGTSTAQVILFDTIPTTIPSTTPTTELPIIHDDTLLTPTISLTIPLVAPTIQYTSLLIDTDLSDSDTIDSPRLLAVLGLPGQLIPIGQPYRTQPDGVLKTLTAKKSVGSLPTHRLASRYLSISSSFNQFTSDDSSRDSLSDPLS
ncbi:hypothetical protein Tco_0820662 [Tanacetum coccineum]|uniref:Reverse transcriptase domain-containing protein n=1 Tax=Tanacetum coccineum TaxID=301880 RepID=A0ABQ5AE86_9ASTR